MFSIFSANKWSKKTKFIFVPVDFRFYFLGNIFKFFDVIGVTNSILLQREKILKVYAANKFIGKGIIYEIKDKKDRLDIVFPDKLKDMKDYTYKLGFVDQPPRLTVHRHIPFGVDFAIFKTIINRQNAKVWVGQAGSQKAITELLQHKQIDLTLNTGISEIANTFLRYINTYDENGYCSLIPIPPRLSFLHYLLTPFDGLSWIFLIVCTLTCAFVWRLLRKSEDSDSEWYFIYGIITNFIGQSIPFRNNRRMQVIILQLSVLMTFIMGNAYQSLIITAMTTSREGIRLKTIDEMFASDLKFKVDPIFYDIVTRSGDSKSIIDRMEKGRGLPDYEKLSNDNYAVIGRCDMIEYSYNVESNAGEFYYMLPEKMMPFYEKFMLSPMSPFYEMLQKYHDYAFESGIRQFWHEFFKHKKIVKYSRENEYYKNEEYYLSMKDVYGCFYILLVGYSVAGVVLLIEIFWHDCLKRAEIKKSLTQKVHKLAYREKRMRVRRVQVQPIEDIEGTGIEFCV
jgi:hypothetical protein